MMKLIWTHEALTSLMDIEDYIAADNPERARTFVDDIIAKAETLLPANPRLGRVVPEAGRPEIREILHQRYRIVYKISGNSLLVLVVFAAQRELRHADLEAGEHA